MTLRTILITGGAGYIGSYVTRMLQKSGYRTIVLDNLSKGKREAVSGLFFEGTIGDEALLRSIFTGYTVDAVLHFAAFIDVGESVKDPARYYRNNVSDTLVLLRSMIEHGVKKIVFSSTAAIFGYPLTPLIAEDHPCIPLNPYGASKRMVEQILEDLDRAHALKFCSLRYFNAAGGDPEGKIKYKPTAVTNLIPRALTGILNGEVLTVFGTDYPTPDGTCIRDYIHIEDLASAHLHGLKRLEAGEDSCRFNLGNGKGYSVKEMIEAVERVTGKLPEIRIGPRRLGDPPILVADSSHAARTLGWIPRYPDPDSMVAHAWNAMNGVDPNE